MNDTLNLVFTEEGYVQVDSVKNDRFYKTYCYTITDYLGHTRVVVNEDKEVVQETAYYPYGMPIAELSTETKYNYLYTGKEFLENFGVNWYDHHARYFDPEIGRWWAIDPALQGVSPYMAMGNNPVLYVDENGEFFFIFPTIGWSKKGGLSIGITAGIGIPGVASAQISTNYNFKYNDFSVALSGTLAFNTVYAAWSSQSGFSVGYAAGLTPYSGVPVSSNLFSVGADYNITHDSWSGNLSAWGVNQSGWNFNPSASAMIFQEHSTNLVRGQGFRSNDKVLSRFVDAGQHQKALDYFGFKGKYSPNKAAGAEYAEGKDYFGSVSPSTGEISYGNLAFQSYDHLLSIYMKELYTSRKVKSGRGVLKQSGFDFRNEGGIDYTLFPEEADGFIHQYRNNGFYRNVKQGSILGNISFYQRHIFDSSMNPSFSKKWWHWIYRIPRKY